MKLSAKSDYAARAILGLARRHQSGASLSIEKLAEEQGIPPNYLTQILIELKSQLIVKSVRGPDGGYLLARAPAEISMADVLRCVHGDIFDTPALEDPLCPPELKQAWKKLQQTLDSAATGLTFQKLLELSAEKDKMYYI